MAMAVAGMLMYPTVINNAGTAIHLLGFPVTYAKYSGSVIPIILSVWVLKYVYKGVNKVIPDFLRMLFAPICVSVSYTHLGSQAGNLFDIVQRSCVIHLIT